SFSGLTYPFIGMNKVVATLGKVLFPFTHYLDIFVDQSMRGAPVWYSLGDVAVLCLFVLAGMASMPFLRMLCKDQRQWGRL
ncbi:MAG: ABC transporter permease, partial [Rikenellaceae bacterium]|nr:ABC transporter permease [Rikenellaceae bacterium]